MMDQGDRGHPRARKGPWLTDVVEGDPLQVAGRELVPFVRVTSWVGRRASLRSGGVSGQGYGFVHVQPVAIVDSGKEDERHQIRDETARALGRLGLVALLVPLLTMLLIYVSRRLDGDVSRGSFA